MTYSCPEEKRNAIVRYLRSNIDSGNQYFKAKTIANELGLSSREVGANLKKLVTDGVSGLEIEKHAVSRATTWRVSQASSETMLQASD